MMNVFVYVDALPFKSISAQHTPFMKKLVDEGDNCTLRNIMGYSFAIQSTILSGKLPLETKHWMPYAYAPYSTLYTTRALAPLARKASINVQKPHFLDLMHYGMSKFFMSKFLLPKKAKISCIPWSLADRFYIYPYYYMNELPYFDQLRKKLQKKHGVKLLYFGPPQQRKGVVEDVIGYIDHLPQQQSNSSRDKLFIIVYLDHLDSRGHGYGVGSPIWRATLAKLDKDLKTLHEFLNEKIEDFNFAVFSDHGMCNVERTLDMLKPLRIAGLNWKHVTAFVDATIMNIWMEGGTSKHAVLKAFEKIGSDKIVILDRDNDANMLRESGVPFEDKTYGDLIIQAKPCHMFFPNFYSTLKPFKGVHGFYPSEVCQQSFLNLTINSGSKVFSKPQHIKDINQFMLSLASSN